MGNVSADGKVLWLSGRYDHVVYAFDTTTGEAKIIKVGIEPHGLAVGRNPGATRSATPATCGESRRPPPARVHGARYRRGRRRGRQEARRGKEVRDLPQQQDHGDAKAVYLRKDRKVTSLDKLKAQVALCNSELNLQLFPTTRSTSSRTRPDVLHASRREITTRGCTCYRLVAALLSCRSVTRAARLRRHGRRTRRARSSSRSPPIRRKAIHEARAALQKADAAGHKPARLLALRLLAMAHDALDDNPGLRDASRKGLPLALELGDKDAEVEFMIAEGMSLFNEGRHAQSIRMHDHAITFAQSNGFGRNLAKAYIAKAHVLVGQERSSEAMELLLKGHALLENQGEKLLMSAALSAIGNILTVEDASREDLLRAIDYHKRAMALLDPGASKYEASTIYYNLGVAYSSLKDYPEALKVLEKCLAIGREIDDPHTVAFVNYRMGQIELEQKRPERAVQRYDAALPGFQAAENVALQFLTHLGRARALSALHKRKESLAALEAAAPLAKRLDSPGRDVQYHEAAAEAHANLGEWDQAYEAQLLLRAAERRAQKAANQKLSQELQARFGAKQRETENELLRVEGRMQEDRRVVLLVALVLTLLVAVALVLYVVRQSGQKRRFASLAMRDDLTGLPNRRSILEFAKIQYGGRRAGDSGFVLALIDLDHFKSINDELGHSVGDEVLREIAIASLKALRTVDRLGRFGGEEFVLVMPGFDIERVPAVFERLRLAVNEIRAKGYPEGRPLTFSMGATAARPSDPDLDSIIKRADEALYRAKNNGRNRFEVS
jgi:diguanylate cyclase (GGDEF)-like protein